MIRHYATVCRDWQLPVLLASMRRHCGDFRLHALAWDWRPIGSEGADCLVRTREGFLARHPDFEPSRLPGPPRSPIDTVVTMRWRFFADVMEETGAPLTTLDGDLWFWSSPEPMFAEIGAAKLAVCPHRIPPRSAGLPGVTFETHRQFGLFNTGLVYMAGVSIAREMAELNHAWSYTDVVERPGKRPLFGDQSALEDIVERSEDVENARGIMGDGLHEGIQDLDGHPGALPKSEDEGLREVRGEGDHGLRALEEVDDRGGDDAAGRSARPRYGRTHVIRHPGVNLAPWNIHSHHLEPGAPPRVNGQPLIVFHYSSLRLDSQICDPAYAITARQAEILYAPYLNALAIS